MFRDFLKVTVKNQVKASILATPIRIQEAIILNSAPYVEVSYLPAMKPEVTIEPQFGETKNFCKDALQEN